ncbi:ATP-binding cassette domain-containing protein, partial [Leucobacter soli]
MTAGSPLVEASGLTKRYRVPPTRLFQRAGTTTAVEGVDLTVSRGESVAIVGESGSGKSTLLRLLLGLSRATSGSVHYIVRTDDPARAGDPASTETRTVDPARDDLLWLRRRAGMVFQDPYSTFDPRRTIGLTVAEPLVATGAEGDHRAAVAEILAR